MKYCMSCGKTISDNKVMCAACLGKSGQPSNEAAMTRIERQWNTYASQYLGPDMPPEVIFHLKRAFFGGAAAFYDEIMSWLGPGSEAIEQDLRNLGLMEAELRRFMDKVKVGLA